MTSEELRAALHPPRLPAEFAALGPRDLLAALGIGLILAALLWLLLRPATLRQSRPDPRAEARALSALPPPERQARRAALLVRLTGPLPADLSAALYRRGEEAATEARLTRMLDTALRRRG